MKKIFSFCMLLLLSMPASAWVILTDVQEKVPGVLLPKIINQQGQNIRVCMDVLDKNDKSMYNTPADRPEALQHYNATKPFIASAYKTWFDTLRSTIINSGRQSEFADVLALLPKQDVSFIFINPNATPCLDDSKQDLYIRLDPLWDNNGAAYMNVHNNFSAITLSRGGYTLPDLFKRSILHETGHTLGLGDMYAGRENADYNSKFYTMANIQKLSTIPSCMNKNCNGTISTKFVMETFEQLGEGGSRQTSQRHVTSFEPYSDQPLTCDDMDGLVNVLDFYFPDKMSTRRTQGWLSFCPDRNVAYAASMPVALSAAEKDAFAQFVSNGRQGLSPLAGKTEPILQMIAAKQQAQAQEKARMEQEERQKQVQDSLTAALKNAAREKEYQKKVNSTYVLPRECAICHKPVTLGRDGDGTMLCDRDENGNIGLGCIIVHKACKGDLKYKSKLQQFIKSLPKEYVSPTNRVVVQ